MFIASAPVLISVSTYAKSQKTSWLTAKVVKKCENYFFGCKFLRNLILQHTGSYLKCRHNKRRTFRSGVNVIIQILVFKNIINYLKFFYFTLLQLSLNY